jgi:hypothetical protein
LTTGSNGASRGIVFIDSPDVALNKASDHAVYVDTQTAPGAGKSLTVQGGGANTTGAGGAIAVKGGVGAGVGAGGDVNITSGIAGVTGAGGNINITGTNSNAGLGGSVFISTGAGVSTANGASINVDGGDDGGSGVGGTVGVVAGSGAAPAQQGGDVQIIAGDGSTTAGTVELTPGTGPGGQVNINTRVSLPATLLGSYIKPAGGSTTLLTTANMLVGPQGSIATVTAINLPVPSIAGQIFIVKDENGKASTKSITVVPMGGTIDLSGGIVISTDFGSVTFYAKDTLGNYAIIAAFNYP